jgi:hypothetical protein
MPSWKSVRAPAPSPGRCWHSAVIWTSSSWIATWWHACRPGRLRKAAACGCTPGDALEDPACRTLAARPASGCGWWATCPYNVSTPLLFRLHRSQAGGSSTDMVFMVQREVAARATARHGPEPEGLGPAGRDARGRPAGYGGLASRSCRGRLSARRPEGRSRPSSGSEPWREHAAGGRGSRTLADTMLVGDTPSASAARPCAMPCQGWPARTACSRPGSTPRCAPRLCPRGISCAWPTALSKPAVRGSSSLRHVSSKPCKLPR